MIHGILHLCGYNDKTELEQKEMTKMENWALDEMKRFT
jgi:ssRNA-specific RNase YbeY (16S rRNA maturation enzyme)